MTDIDLDLLDRDGALREAASKLPLATRRDFLVRAGTTLGAGGLLLGGLGAVSGAVAQAGDVDILNYALTLEYLQAGFYSEAESMGALTGIPARAAAQIGGVERAHVTALRDGLGSAAVKRPTFDFQGVTGEGDAFLRTAVAFEDLATGAYKAQLANITTPAYLAAALSIHSVEARHAAWIRYLAGREPAANALDASLPRREAERIVASTGFIVAAPATDSRNRPTFAG